MLIRNVPAIGRAGTGSVCMKVNVVSQQSILQETVEALSMYVNDYTVNDVRRWFFQKCDNPLDEAERLQYEQIFSAMEDILRKTTEGLERDDPRLRFFFQNFGKSDADRTCLAWVMLGAFYGGRSFALDEGLQECHQEFKDFARDDFSHYKITGITKKGLLAYPMEEGEMPIPLLEQVESLELPWDSKWNIYKCLMAYDAMLEELGALIRPVAARMQSAMDDHSDLFQQIVGYWQGYFAGHDFHDFVASTLGISETQLAAKTDEAVVWLGWMAKGDIDHYQGADWEGLNIGILIRVGRDKKSIGYIQEDVINILKLLSDRSKFEIIQRLSDHDSYGLELAKEMCLTGGTISKHLTTLFSCGLLSQQRIDSRVYYRTDETAIRRFLAQLEKSLLGAEKSRSNL